MVLRLGLVSLLLAAATVLQPGVARADDCSRTSCAAPTCPDTVHNVRPGGTRELRVTCRRVVRAVVVAQPDHATVTEVRVDSGELRLVVVTDADAAGTGEVGLELTGQDGPPRRVDVPLRVVAPTENEPPACWAADTLLRTDGTGPVDVYPDVACWDPDGDAYTMVGTGGGTHRESPRSVPAWQNGLGGWPYRTAIASGTETATVHAVDELGARSADASFTVTVGPGVDRPANCSPASYDLNVYARPGVVREFPVFCNDPDGDGVTPSLSTAPTHGAMTLTEHPDSAPTFRRLVGRYVPLGLGVERDPFALTASVAGRADVVTHAAIVQRPLPENGGASCGWGGVSVPPGQESVRDAISCWDDEDDALSATVATAPVHGTADVEVVRPGGGQQQVRLRYRPVAGFEGVDCVVVRLSDGYGYESLMTIDVAVEDPPPVPTWWGPVPPSPESPPIAPAPVRPPSPTPAPTAPAAAAKVVARSVLGTQRVVRVPVMDGVVAYAPARLSRKRLAKAGRAPGLVVTCARDCALRTKAVWHTRRRASAARRTTVSAGAGAPQVVWATSPAPTGRSRLDLRLAVASGSRRATVRHRLAVGR